MLAAEALDAASELASWLGTVDVWVGGGAGDTTTLCGSASYDASSEPSAYIVSCGGGILGSCCHSSVRVAECHSCTLSGAASPSRTVGCGGEDWHGCDCH